MLMASSSSEAEEEVAEEVVVAVEEVEDVRDLGSLTTHWSSTSTMR